MANQAELPTVEEILADKGPKIEEDESVEVGGPSAQNLLESASKKLAKLKARVKNYFSSDSGM